jgi:hypothetical protein
MTWFEKRARIRGGKLLLEDRKLLIMANEPRPPDQDPEDFISDPKTNPASYPDDPNQLPPGVRNWPIAGDVAKKKADDAKAAADKAAEAAKKAEEEATKAAEDQTAAEAKAAEVEKDPLANPTVNPQPPA